HAFDPLPDVADWIARRALPANFTFHRWAAVGRDGELPVFRGSRDCHDVYRRASTPGSEHPTEKTLAYSLRTVMKKLRHEHVDVLKISIGAVELTILDELVRTDVRPGQLLLDFRDRNCAREGSAIAVTIRRLRAIGYRIFSVSDSGRGISMLLSSASLNATTKSLAD
ncbi:MAG: hypothetical protein RIA65_02420, partial [Woeseia sp.]